MKVGILTFHHSNYNYGAVLQTYAIYHLIRSLGHETYIINYIPVAKGFRKKLAAVIVALLGFNFRKFRKKHIPGILHKTNNYRELKQLNNMLDAFVVGSDQVWRPRPDTDSMYHYFLDFADDQKHTLAYAASFGVDYWDAPDSVTEKIRTLISRFDAVSVREQSGVTICKNIFNVDSTTTLDPTLVLDKTFFERIIEQKPTKKIKHKTMVYMMLDDSKSNEVFFKKYAQKLHMKFERINGKRIVSKKGFFYYKSVGNWLYNIKQAEVVVTDSFHCTVFSILFQKKFLCVANPYRGTTRLENLLKLLQLEAKLIYRKEEAKMEQLLENIKYQKVHQLLEQEKKLSLKFLKKNLADQQ